MHTEKIFFENPEGHRLAALLDSPEGDEPIAYALFAHCFTCSKNYKGVSHVSRALAAQGFAVLRFDFTGLGESEGEFSDTNFSSNVADLVAAAGFMERTLQAPAVLVGHSLGGTAMLRAASRIPSARAVATIAAPSSPRHLLRHLSSRVDEIERDGQAEVDLGGRPFRIKKQLLDDVEEVSLRDAVEGLGRALLVLHSPLDSVVGIDNATEIFTAARHPKSFVSLDSADHLLSDRRDAQYAGNLIASWARRYIGEPQEVRIQE